MSKKDPQRIEYTRLEREINLRVQAQQLVLKEQGQRLDREREDLYKSILDRSGIDNTTIVDAQFYNDHAEVKIKGGAKHGSVSGKVKE